MLKVNVVCQMVSSVRHAPFMSNGLVGTAYIFMSNGTSGYDMFYGSSNVNCYEMLSLITIAPMTPIEFSTHGFLPYIYRLNIDASGWMMEEMEGDAISLWEPGEQVI